MNNLLEDEKFLTPVCARKILVVDDDPHFRTFIRDALAELAPEAIVREAVNGSEASMEVTMFRPDLVLLDYVMSDMNGSVVCQRIKSDPSLTGIRIVGITGCSRSNAHVELAGAGADKVLLKPLSIATIVELLNQFGFMPAMSSDASST